MKCQWQNKTWGDIATLEYGKGLRDYRESEGQYPVFGTNGQIGWHTEPLCPHPGVIVGRKGAYRGIHYSDQPFYVIDTAFYLIPTEGIDLKWAYYQLLTVDINSMDSGTAIPSTSRDAFYQIPVKVPPISEQRAIAEILGNLDDKIDLNRQMNATLEGIARAIFTSWFVDFDPVHAKAQGEAPAGMDAATAALFPDAFVASELGPIPAGWEICPLDEIAHYQNGLAWKRYAADEDAGAYLSVIKIREMRMDGFDEKSDRTVTDIKPSCKVYDGDVLFSWSGSLLVDIWTGGDGALNQHLFKVTSEQYPKWFYYYWTKEHLERFQRIAAAKATTMGHIRRRDLAAAMTLVPPESVLKKMDEIMAPLLEKFIHNRLESRTLAELRDTLLPKLISGELRVPEEIRQD